MRKHFPKIFLYLLSYIDSVFFYSYGLVVCNIDGVRLQYPSGGVTGAEMTISERTTTNKGICKQAQTNLPQNNFLIICIAVWSFFALNWYSFEHIIAL